MIRLLAAPDKIKRIANHRRAKQKLRDQRQQPVIRGQMAHFRLIQEEIVYLDRHLEDLAWCFAGPKSLSHVRACNGIHQRRVAEGFRILNPSIDQRIYGLDFIP